MRPEQVTLPRVVDFCRMPRPVQERFAAVTRGTAPPAPLLFRAARQTQAVWSLASSGVLAFVAILVCTAGWGDLSSPLAIHGPKMLAVDLVLLCGVAYGIVHAIALLRAVVRMPYRPGTYLFPACLIEARSRMLRVWPMNEAQSIERIAGPSPGLLLRMCDGSRVFIAARSTDEAERAVGALASLRPALLRALDEDDARILVELDPLHDGALSNPFGPTESMKHVAPAWTRFDWAVAAGAGVVLGLAFGQIRNATSDEAVFRSVAAMDSVPGYERYLLHRGRHASDVRDRLLPAAQLRDAEARAAAVRQVLRARLADAQRLGTVSALDDFRRRYPDSKLDAELAAARHAVYARAFRAWEQKVHPDADTAAWVEGLLGWGEKNVQPTLDVRFQLQPSRTLGEADGQVAQSIHYPGPDALPSRHLTADAMRKHEERFAHELAAAFARDFAPDLLSVRATDPLPAGAPEPTDAPALIITYAPEWAFSTEASDRPQTVFAGLRFAFEATFALPTGLALTLESETWRAPQAWKTRIQPGESREDYEQRVYDLMADDAFEQLADKVTSSL